MPWAASNYDHKILIEILFMSAAFSHTNRNTIGLRAVFAEDVTIVMARSGASLPPATNAAILFAFRRLRGNQDLSATALGNSKLQIIHFRQNKFQEW